MFRLNDKEYVLARIGLVRAACPREIAGTRDNLRGDIAIRVENNDRGLGGVARLGYKPRGLVVAGGLVRTRLLERGAVHAFAFVENGALTIRADDAIGCSELMDKLRVALCDKLLGAGRESAMPGQAYPSIVEVYPFENYMIFQVRGDKYRQGYFLDAVARVVKLLNNAVKVEEKFVDAGGPGSGRHGGGGYDKSKNTEHPFHQTLMQHGFSHTGSTDRTHFYKGNQSTREGPDGGTKPNSHWTVGHGVSLTTRNGKPGWHDNGDMNRSGKDAGSLAEHLQKVGYHDKHLEACNGPTYEAMPRVQTGTPYSGALPAGNDQTMTQGARNSELVTMIVRNLANVNKAVDNYLAAIRNGQHKPPQSVPMFAPALLVNNKVAGLAARGIDVYDFAKWCAAQEDDIQVPKKPTQRIAIKKTLAAAV